MSKIYLKNGFIVDGTGEEGYMGNVLIENNRIKEVSKTPISVENCEIIDCKGRIIAPGFIDSHSHQDRYIFYKNELEMTEPFIRQGITTYVAGNCGYSVAGIEKSSPYKEQLRSDPSNDDPIACQLWDTYEEYFEHLNNYGMRQNMAVMAGHGVALGSIVGLSGKEPITENVRKRVEYLLEEGMDSGCKGISFGLGYRPGSFISDDEVRETSEIVIRRNKLITVHSRVLSVFGKEIKGEPGNVKWHREFIERFKDSDARLQISHLLFVGKSAYPTYDAMFEMFDNMVENGGMDLWFDMYSYTQGVSGIQVLMPQMFYQRLPDIYEDKGLMAELNKVMETTFDAVGILPSDIQLCNPIIPEYQRYKGMFMDEICSERDMNVAELYTELYKGSNGYARIYFYCEQSENNIAKQMLHPRALYMTDAAIAPGCHQNQCAYNSMPKFLRLSRETNKQSIEITIAKMTGNAALRFDILRRGFIKSGYYADIVVFDPDTIADTSTPKVPESDPIGIEHVFINGSHILNNGFLDSSSRTGMLV